MLQNYIKTAFRFLLKNISFSFINIIGLATVSFQAIKAAVANPVKSLRTE
jgi:hypothetical protein